MSDNVPTSSSSISESLSSTSTQSPISEDSPVTDSPADCSGKASEADPQSSIEQLQRRNRLENGEQISQDRENRHTSREQGLSTQCQATGILNRSLAEGMEDAITANTEERQVNRTQNEPTPVPDVAVFKAGTMQGPAQDQGLSNNGSESSKNIMSSRSIDTDSLTQKNNMDKPVGAKNTRENDEEMDQTEITAPISDLSARETSALLGVALPDIPLIEGSGATRSFDTGSQLRHQISGSDRLDQLFKQTSPNWKKRQLIPDNDNLKLRKLPRRSLFLNISKIENEDRLESLRMLGLDWTEFYRTHVDLAELPPDRISHILSLVWAIACPQVILDVHDRLRSMFDRPPEFRRAIEISKAYWLHQKAESSIICGHFQQCLLEVFIYKTFKDLHEERKRLMKDQRRERQRKDYQPPAFTPTDSKPYDATHYALNDLTAQCLDMTPEELELDATHQLDRQKLRKLKDRGKALLQINKQLGSEYASAEVWCLFPMRRIKTPLDASVSVNQYVIYPPSMALLKPCIRYVDLKGKDLEVFVAAVQKLRPRLPELCFQAWKLDWLFFGSYPDEISRLKLETIDPETIANAQLDSELLFTCFKAQASTEAIS